MSENLGQLSDRLFELRRRKDQLNSDLSQVQQEIDSVEYTLIQRMEDTGLDQLRSAGGLVSKKVELYPQVDDIAALVDWAAANGRADILQRRVTKKVFEEVFEQTGEYPEGVKTYEKKTLNYRKAK